MYTFFLLNSNWLFFVQEDCRPELNIPVEHPGKRRQTGAQRDIERQSLLIIGLKSGGARIIHSTVLVD